MNQNETIENQIVDIVVKAIHGRISKEEIIDIDLDKAGISSMEQLSIAMDISEEFGILFGSEPKHFEGFANIPSLIKSVEACINQI